MKEANERVQPVLDQLVQGGTEVGLQVAAYLDGRLVVDAWAGMANPAAGRPVTGDTLFKAQSCTKGIVATCIHILADRGMLDYDMPIAHYWPEFATHGKERVTIRHALTHQAGIPQMPEQTTLEMMCDWDTMCTAIADLEPLWEPGTKTGYHALTFGWILGEVLRRVDGRSIARFVQEEICRPLGTEDIYIGTTEAVEPRVATPVTPSPPSNPTPLPPGLLLLRAIPALTNPAAKRHPDVQRALNRASIPSSGGFMTARALARHYAALAQGGELNGVHILTPELIRVASQLQTEAFDEVLGPVSYPAPVRKALGYWVGGQLTPANTYWGSLGLRNTTFGHTGMGGLVAFADPEQRFAFAFLKNFSAPMNAPLPHSAYMVAQAARAALGLTG
jgi:CubicO group peptidase (beta-lactamase class C family)